MRAKRSALMVLCLVLFAAVPAGADEPAAPHANDAPASRSLTLDEALAAAGQAPARKIGTLRVKAAERGVSAAGEWPTTKLGGGSSVGEGPRLLVTGSIPLPLLGVTSSLSAARAAAHAELDAARAELGVTELELRKRVIVAWVELARAEALADLAGAAASREQELADATHKRFDAGDVPRAEVVAADAALARARAEASAARTVMGGASATLAGELAWDPEAPLHAEGGVPQPTPRTLADLRREAATHPSVKSAAAHVAAAAAEAHAVDAATLPTLAIDAEAELWDPSFDTGTSHVKIILALELPIGSHRGAKRDAARVRIAAAEAERDAILATTDAGLVAAYRRWQAAEARARAFENEVLPAQREAAALARAAYVEGQGDLTAVIQANQALLEIERESVGARADAVTAWAELPP